MLIAEVSGPRRVNYLNYRTLRTVVVSGFYSLLLVTNRHRMFEKGKMKSLELTAFFATLLGSSQGLVKGFQVEAFTSNTISKIVKSSVNHEKAIFPSVGLNSIGKSTSLQQPQHAEGMRTMTSLNMAVPPFIISPMIRRWQEEQRKKNLPMASAEERLEEAPGLRVGAGAWKWPQIWPYDDTFFRPMGSSPANPAGSITTLLSNGVPSPTAGVPPFAEVGQELDVITYWGEDKKLVTTDIDADSAELIRRHYSYYLEDGMDILELGAAEESYLPENIKLNRLVGVGLSPELMEQNPSLTEKLVINLNKVEPDVGVEELERLGSDTFDAILMANTIDFLTDPKEVFRSAWKLLKPGGIMIVPFMNKDAYADKFEKAQTKMWRDFNDDQHMWVCGSFFHFSAAEGWDGLKGFDLSSGSEKKSNKSNVPIIGDLLNPKSGKAYVVQARKAIASESIDETDPTKSFRSLMWVLPTLEDRDKTLVALRLGRTYTISQSDETKLCITKNIHLLPKVYQSLIKMDQFQFPFSLQSQLAANVVADPDFVANDQQLEALKMGLGLARPSKSFWEPVGRLTANMQPEDKVNLLAYIVPRFGSNNPEQEDALEAFVSGLKPTFELIRSKCPQMSEDDVQLIGSELLAIEVLIPGRSTRSEFARWLSSMTQDEIEELLTKRKSSREKAMSEMRKMQIEREAAEEKRKEQLKMFNDQVEKARKDRTVTFNERTGKLEVIENKIKK